MSKRLKLAMTPPTFNHCRDIRSPDYARLTNSNILSAAPAQVHRRHFAREGQAVGCDNIASNEGESAYTALAPNIGYRLSDIGCRASAVGHRLWAVGYRAAV
jgi:hypothetical protein